FLAHDGWAYFKGIIVGPNDNAQPIDYRNSIYGHVEGTAFKGVLHNNNFAATCRALFKKGKDGSWQIAKTDNANYPSSGYAVGSDDWVGDPGSDFAWDIFGDREQGKR